MERICVGVLLGAMMGGSMSQLLAVGDDRSPLDAHGVPCDEIKRDRNVRALFESLDAQGLLLDPKRDTVAELLDACNALLLVSRLSLEKPLDPAGNSMLHTYQIKGDACLRTIKRGLRQVRAGLPQAHHGLFDEAADEIRQVCEDKVHNIVLRPVEYRSSVF